MAKRISGHLVKINQNYTVEEASELLRVNERTVRSWIKDGLQILDDQRPVLILGCELRSFLQARTQSKKQPVAADEIFCMRCRKGQRPYGKMIDYIPIDDARGRIVGICECCDAPITRFASKASLPQLLVIFDITNNRPGKTKRTHQALPEPTLQEGSKHHEKIL